MAQMLPIVEAAFRTDTKRTYMPYNRFLVNGEDGYFPGLADAWVDEVTFSQLNEALKAVQTRALDIVSARNDVRQRVGRATRRTNGKSSEYNAVGAWRNFFEVAIADGYLPEGANPALKLTKPKRKDGKRPALTREELDQMFRLVDNSGDDPELDRMLCETILVSGARQEGLLNLTVAGMDLDECAILLDEKFGKAVWQPVPDWFIKGLWQFAISRGATLPGDKVFVKRATGPKAVARPITGRRFDNLFTDRIQAAFEWADKRKVGGHTLRHHGTTVIERHAGRAVATAFARQEPEGVNGIYTEATPREVAAAVVGVYGGDHPWLHREPRVVQ
jgi:integrase